MGFRFWARALAQPGPVRGGDSRAAVWPGEDFDPAEFSVDEVNARLAGPR